jgi:hypothetical protein
MDTKSKKLFIIKTSARLPKHELINLLSMLVNEGTVDVLQHSDGCRVNLDKLNDHLIIKLYEYILRHEHRI